MAKKRHQWEEVEGVRNFNAELLRSRHWTKNLIERIFGEGLVVYLKYLRSLPKLREQARLQRLPRKQVQQCDSLAIVTIGTSKYVEYFPKFYESLKKSFLPKTKKHFFMFTDRIDYPYFREKKDVTPVKIEHINTTLITLFRFKYVYSIKSKLKNFSHVLYIDSDSYATGVLTTEDDFFCHNKPLFAVAHPGFLNARQQLERNPLSTAAIEKGVYLDVYRQCSFWGGKSKELLEMCGKIDKNTMIDLNNKIIAMWLDESHLNKYFFDHRNLVYTHDSGYSYHGLWPHPKGYKVRIVHKK